MGRGSSLQGKRRQIADSKAHKVTRQVAGIVGGGPQSDLNAFLMGWKLCALEFWIPPPILVHPKTIVGNEYA